MQDSGIQGWLLYDGSCGFCSRWVPFWENTLKKRGFHIAPLQSAWVSEQLKIPQNELAADLRLVLAQRRTVARSRSLSILNEANLVGHAALSTFDLARLRTLFNAGYRAFADNRYWISRACHLPATEQTKQDRSL